MVIPDWRTNKIPSLIPLLIGDGWEVFSGGWLGVSSGTRGLGCLPEIGYFVPSSFRQSQAIFTLALRRWQLSRRYIMYTSVDFGIHHQRHPMTHDHNGELYKNTTLWWVGLNLCGGELQIFCWPQILTSVRNHTRNTRIHWKCISSWLKFMGCFFPKLSNSVSVSWAIANFRSLKTWKDGQRRSWRITMEEKRWIWWKQQIHHQCIARVLSDASVSSSRSARFISLWKLSYMKQTTFWTTEMYWNRLFESLCIPQ